MTAHMKSMRAMPSDGGCENRENDMDRQNGSNLAPVALPAMLDLAAAPNLLEVVRAAAPSGAAVRLDASAVEVLTLPCVQIIVAALTSGARVLVDNPSAAFVEAFAEYGIDWQGLAGAVPADDPAARPDEMPSDKTAAIKRILTIDDSKTIRDMLRLTLARAGYEVLQAVDGQDGVEVLSREQVDLVITDINMPRMDGYGVIRHARGLREYERTPILVLTTESEHEKRNLAREAGATGWMVKPFDPEQLVATINKVAC
jgi:two-component system chemotaxis response regulator CheY